MPRLKLTLQYDGTRYAGWQVQPNGPSIQAALQDAFETIQLGRLDVTGASRTDAGVHATGQVCHVDVSADAPDAHRLLRSLNGVLARDIRVVHVEPVADNFHARYDATAKTYRYLIATHPAPPLLRHCVWEHLAPLDTDVMAAALQGVLGEHDFAPFQAAGTDVTDTVRTMHAASLGPVHFPGLTPPKAPLLALDISGNGFLYKMVRLLTGTLVEIGCGRAAAGYLEACLRDPTTKRAQRAAPALGLCLCSITY